MTPGQLEAFSQMTITQGIDAAAPVYLPLLALSPCALGFMIPALPHSLVFCFGEPVDLRHQHPLSLASLFRPRVFGSPRGLERQELMSSVTASDGEELLGWWVGRLNRIYSYIADPTRWVDSEWRHDAAAQTAWFVTLERLIGDAVSLVAEPQATDLHRVQVAFDLLDKAPPLLGYSRSDSSKGFCALLRREQSLRRLHEAYASMPGDLATRVGDEAERLFDGLYAKVRENTLRHRLTDEGALIGRKTPEGLVHVDNDTLVAELCRAVRNSSHGLLDMLRAGNERYLLAANTDSIPAELPALAPLIALGLLADAESLVDGSWRGKLVGAHGRSG